MPKSSWVLRIKPGIFANTLACRFVTLFFQTKVYLLATDSIFVPSMNKFFSDKAPA